MNHINKSQEILHQLNQHFPKAAIGVSGSVALNTNKPTSDIDLVFIDNHVNSYRLSFEYKNTAINLFAFQPNIVEIENSYWLEKFHSMPISLIYKTKTFCDPQKRIENLKVLISEEFIRREILTKYILTELKHKIESLISSETNGIIDTKKQIHNIVRIILKIFFIKNLKTNLSKEEALNPFKSLQKTDKQLFNSIKELLPIDVHSKEKIKELYFNYVKLNY